MDQRKIFGTQRGGAGVTPEFWPWIQTRFSDAVNQMAKSGSFNNSGLKNGWTGKKCSAGILAAYRKGRFIPLSR